MRKIAREAVWLSSQLGGKERVPIVRKVSYLKEKLPLRDVGPTPSSSFSSDILCPQPAAFTFVIFQFSLLPSCSFISSLSFQFLFPLHPPPSSMPSRLHPSPRLGDAALGLKKSCFIEFLTPWELLFDYDLIHLWIEEVPPSHAWW